MSKGLRVADLFCGPGGLSEGMRLGGCEIVYGFDKARDAVTTFRNNHPGAEVVHGDVLELDFSSIPKFDILVGGPPCVNFSQSKGSRANVLEGLKLVQAFLKLVYIRKPKYWIMENVPRIALHLPDTIPLKWIGVNKDGHLSVPLRHEFNCADYGVPQNRKRYLIGNYPIPEPTHASGTQGSLLGSKNPLKKWRTLSDVLNALGSPYEEGSGDVQDPNYDILIKRSLLADHIHSVDIEQDEIRRIRTAKTNHPYMGFMPFPDEVSRPARTVVATQLGRETLVLETQKGRYRRATVRECATIQTFPIDYHFFGNSINSRYKQAGDAVPPLLVSKIAKIIHRDEGRSVTPSQKRPNRQPPPPAMVRKRKASSGPLPLAKRYNRIVPSKEVRGSRVDFDNQLSPKPLHQFGHEVHVVGWAARLHLGEGKLAKQETVLSVHSVLCALVPLLAIHAEFVSALRNITTHLAKELPGIVPDATTLQAIYTRRHSGGATPDELVSVICSAVDMYFPKADYADIYVPNSDHYCIRQPRKGIRSRIILGGLASAYLAELTNTGLAWLSSKSARPYMPTGGRLPSVPKKPMPRDTLSQRVEAAIARAESTGAGGRSPGPLFDCEPTRRSGSL